MKSRSIDQKLSKYVKQSRSLTPAVVAGSVVTFVTGFETDLNGAIQYFDTPLVFTEINRRWYIGRFQVSSTNSTYAGFEIRENVNENHFEFSGFVVAYMQVDYYYVSRLNAGETISSGNNFNEFAYIYEPSNTGVVEQFFAGFNVPTFDGTLYGWAEIAIEVDQLTILRWAYEDQPGQSITAGAIPEPASTGLGLGALALGAAGLRRFRQQRQAD